MGLQIINFHCFQSYQQITQKFQKKYNLHTEKYRFAVFSRMFLVFFLKFLGNLLVTLKTVKIYNLQAHFQKMKQIICMPAMNIIITA